MAKPATPADPHARLWGVIASESPLAVTFAGDTSSTAMQARADDYTPTVGDVVVVDKVGSRLVVAYRIVDA